jgi:hypothetical protein
LKPDEALLQVSNLENLELAADSKSLECLQLFLSRYRAHREPKEYGFLNGSEEFMYHNTEEVDDFIAVRRPKMDKDPFQETLSPKILPVLVFLRNFQDQFQEWLREKVI